ncbi:HupE/UreJ family protein [Sneathiella sp. CAU 1612]|uniref:HupE/UreJ family protein n=1 Tax=Sneathiella sedimenti TaxID=2816034 RepID=A0ABS3F5C4_9PROT|nr:HupE/UreJ family protein [Sneathiella sedimenti]MBO0333548.1 HupE/UreJ family protein [Sneathiella sedimenti]
MMSRSLTTAIAVATTSLLLASPALAHAGPGIVGGFTSGFVHPVLGWDHVVAMVAVGIWGAFLGKPGIWVLPVVFPLVMAVGALLGFMGIAFPAVEAGIASSAIVLGLLIVFMVRPPVWIAGIVVAFFALFHGHAHGAELPAAANAVAYGVGFVLATGLLHLCGIGFGTLGNSRAENIVIRIGGGAITVVGAVFLTGAV